jgi:hypothetical protein
MIRKQAERDDLREASPALVDGHLRLAAAVLYKALLDWKSDDIMQSMDAFMWLASEDSELFVQALQLPDAWNVITQGRESLQNNKRLYRRR